MSAPLSERECSVNRDNAKDMSPKQSAPRPDLEGMVRDCEITLPTLNESMPNAAVMRNAFANQLAAARYALHLEAENASLRERVEELKSQLARYIDIENQSYIPDPIRERASLWDALAPYLEVVEACRSALAGRQTLIPS